MGDQICPRHWSLLFYPALRRSPGFSFFSQGRVSTFIPFVPLVPLSVATEGELCSGSAVADALSSCCKSSLHTSVQLQRGCVSFLAVTP